MTENTIIRLFESCGFGEVLPPVLPVQGGFMHRMFRVNTAGGSYAVKHLNPEIMKRPGVMDNYRRAEKLEQVLEGAGIPIVPAIISFDPFLIITDPQAPCPAAEVPAVHRLSAS